MAVPYDGVGTLIALNAVDFPNYLFWYSATGNFQPTIAPNGGGPIAGTGTTGQWVPFTVPGAGSFYEVPWPYRSQASATVDAEGLQLIMAGGTTFDDANHKISLNDVWQLSWQSSTVAPLISQLTDAAQFPSRFSFMLATVHDWYFLQGGINVDSNGYYNFLDDVWMSGDLGTTWSLYAGDGNGGVGGVTGAGAAYVNRLTLGRRLFIIAPLGPNSAMNNDVFQLVW